VIFGDEMGLGKTVEALAVLCHLRSKGASHFLVVCPASVVTNWTREVTAKSKLRAHRLHGPDRALALRNWRRTGGVAVTTFDMLAWLKAEPSMVTDLGCVVVDEAHYIKNPATRRAQHTSAIIGKCERTVLLTGTPMENRVEEFSNLASYIRPDLAAESAGLTPRAFRKHIAPAYLRRNQEDVLTELPELVEVEEWIPMSAADQARYRQAVSDGNFMAMRQAAFQSGSRSEKLQRLLEIAEEAAKNSRKTIVYSYFRDVLATVVDALPGTVIGPLTGSVPPARRQEMVDRFAAAEEGAVLTAQIAAGGVGLNIQAASVVIICEPQLKPTSEAQAIARAYRMGQVQTVQVHRLLSEHSVDERITELLAAKRQLFDEYARISATADSTPDAVDISDAELARTVIAAERERLLSRPTPIETGADQEL
jgi:SNF2 family DNA or RNA helicase